MAQRPSGGDSAPADLAVADLLATKTALDATAVGYTAIEDTTVDDTADGDMVISAQEMARIVGAHSVRTGLASATGVAFNSTQIKPGYAFFALPGEREHGIAYADEALKRGAAFIVSDRSHPLGLEVEDATEALRRLGSHARSRLMGAVVAISGSAGKTSTKAFVAAALDARASAGNFNTPHALACTLVAAWLSDPARELVLELGIDQPGEMETLTALVRPTHGVLTAIGESHLERLGSLEGVALEKSKLLEASPERYASQGAARLLPRHLPGLVTYGLADGAQVRGNISETGSAGQTLEALGIELRLPFPGRAMAENALAALTLAHRLGFDLARAATRIEGATLEPGRLQRKQHGNRWLLDDTYNSNPASAHEALEVLRRFPAPRVAILGDMLELGEHSPRLHQELGERTRDLDLVIAVGPQARHLVSGNAAALHAESIEAAIALLHRLPSDGTVLVKASRGMRLERVVAALEERSGAAVER